MTLSFGSTVQSLGLPTQYHCHFARGRGSTAGGGGGCSTACKSEETWSSNHLCQVMHAREVDRSSSSTPTRRLVEIRSYIANNELYYTWNLNDQTERSYATD